MSGPTVSLCVTSRDTVPPPHWENVTSAIHYRRLDYEAGYYTNDLPNNLAAETIVTWNADTGDLRMVKIPQTRLERITVQWFVSFIVTVIPQFPDFFLRSILRTSSVSVHTRSS